MKTIFLVFLNKLTALKSLRFLLIVLFFLAGIIPAVVISENVVTNYRTRAVSVRTTEAVDQSRINGNCDTLKGSGQKIGYQK